MTEEFMFVSKIFDDEWPRLKKIHEFNNCRYVFLIADRNRIIQNVASAYIEKGKLMTPTEIAVEIAQQVFILTHGYSRELRSSI